MLTKITRYKTEGKKRVAAHSYRRKIRGALLSLARSVLLCNTPESVDAAAALAQAVSAAGMNNRNYLLFLVLLETNNPTVVDVLIGERNPFLLFSPIKPNWFLVKESFRILAKYKGNELSAQGLLALLGVVQNAYKTSKDGYRIYPLRMSDVYNIGKHLDEARDQLDPRNRLLLEIMYDIYYVGIDSGDENMKQIGIKANAIRMAFFDNTKKLLDAIPDVLLVKDTLRAPLAPRNFQWKAPGPAPGDGLAARAEPEIKVSLQGRRTVRRSAPATPAANKPAGQGGATRRGAAAAKPRASDTKRRSRKKNTKF